jgi:hypothetical protein
MPRIRFPLGILPKYSIGNNGGKNFKIVTDSLASGYLGLFGLSELSCLKVTFCLPFKHYFVFEIFNINFIVIMLSNFEFLLNKFRRC